MIMYNTSNICKIDIVFVFHIRYRIIDILDIHTVVFTHHNFLRATSGADFITQSDRIKSGSFLQLKLVWCDMSQSLQIKRVFCKCNYKVNGSRSFGGRMHFNTALHC